MDISRALAIEGWMEPDELEWLAARASEAHRIVEVGCWLGRSTRALADHVPGAVWCIDHWRGAADDSLRASFPLCQDEAIARFVRNLKEHIDSGRVLYFVGASQELFERMERLADRVDFLFIDADHSEAAVRADINTWGSLVRKNGIIAGHDYGTYDGVTRAVDSLLPEHQRGPGSIWYATA